MLGLVFHQVVKRPQNLKRPQKEEAQKPYLTVYRAGLMIMTCAAILAVDFQFFPRRFAKVEIFGTSLMDMGVGSFVFSSGVVSSRSYMNNKQPSLLKSFRSGFVILLLGFARFFLTKSVDYQEHHSEYGLHWNFFFTLGFLPPVMTLLGFLRKQMPFAVLAIVVIVIYQVVLNLGLQDWVMNAPRTGLISANKEGICSFFGYLSIFLFGLQTGEFIFQNKSIQLPNTSPMSSETSIAFSGGILFLVYNIWIYLFPKYDVSRGMANLPYVLWVVASNLILIFDLIAIEKNAIKFVKSAPPLLVAINNNGLFTFLLANILTGLINLSMRTLYMNTWSSILVNAVDLKAELAHQTEKFNKTRASSGKQSAAKRPEQKRTVWAKQNKGIEARNAKDKQIEEVQSDVLAKSREQLEKKAKIYEAMRSGQYKEEYDDDDEKAPLIDFDRKYFQERQLEEIREETERKLKKRRQEKEAADDPWVEYEDEFGRTRTVRQSQLPNMTVQEEENREDMMLRPDYEMGDGLASRAHIKHYDADKEIRTKGVGFYRFSKDEEEREEQLAKLNKLRDETENARKSAILAAAKRQQMMAKNAEKIRARRAALQARKQHPLKHDKIPSTIHMPDVNEESVASFLQSVRKQVE
ncbi:hypothetical protein G6F32_000394 [Rhizopus arrhizus]|nr:hypothetical protein G6F32_000394 [Rhizopus arrhizus]